jgi:dipeptidyl aminopeptidase/acylaminoacyl peptidase
MRDPLLQTLDVFTIPVGGGAPARVTRALAADTDPVWSPDGRRLAFRSAQEGQPQIYARRVSSTASTDDAIWRSPLDEVPSDWTPAHLIFHARSPASGFDIWALPPGAAAPRTLARTGFSEVDGRVSPDGRLLAYASDEGGHFDIYVSSLDEPARRTRITTAGGTRPQWVSGGRGIVFRRGPEVLRITLTRDSDGLRSSTPVPVATVPGLRDLAVARHGRQFLAITPIDRVQPRHINVVIDWKTLLH